MQQHIRKVHGDDKLPPKKTDTSWAKYTCPVEGCGMTFHKINNLHAHMRNVLVQGYKNVFVF